MVTYFGLYFLKYLHHSLTGMVSRTNSRSPQHHEELAFDPLSFLGTAENELWVADGRTGVLPQTLRIPSVMKRVLTPCLLLPFRESDLPVTGERVQD